MDFYQGKKIIFFDGVCNLCNGFVQFVIDRNKKEDILFSSLQSTAGAAMIHHFNVSNALTTVMFIEDGILYQKSTAALRIAKYLCCLWPVLFLFTVVPAFIRNMVYDFVAKHRYKWFGQKDACMMPSPALKSRFLS
jgi:predicted DCC family thiol-disulfide oxidoreductase YuxK